MDDGKRFYFGQALTETEEIFGVTAKQQPPELARYVPQQRIIETDALILTFDAGQLMRMEFLVNFNFKIPLAPYSAEWKNFERSDFTSLGPETTREEANQALGVWEDRAAKLGTRKVEAGDDLAANEFSVYSAEIQFWNALGINMGKSRRAGGGGLWADGWIIQSTTENDGDLHKNSCGVFRSLSAFCDEFNTAARRKA